MAVRMNQEDHILVRNGKINSSLVSGIGNAHELDGKSYINVDKQARSMLGRLLRMGHLTNFNTFLGKTVSVRAFMNVLSIPDYPIALLRSAKPNVELPPKPEKANRKALPNYWALVAYAVCQRIKADRHLQSLLAKNTLDFIAYKVNEGKPFFNKTIVMVEINHNLSKYIAIIRCVQQMIQENRFTNENIEKFIEECKEAPEKDMLDNIAITLTLKEEMEKESKEEEAPKAE